MALALVVIVSNIKKAEASKIEQASNKQSPGFRIVGYLRDSNVADTTGLNIDFKKITYLNIAFINPDLYGNFITMTGLSAVIKAAHSKNVKVLASIGGCSAPAYYSIDAYTEIFEYIEVYCNHNRFRPSIRYKTPAGFEKNMRRLIKPIKQWRSFNRQTHYIPSQRTERATIRFSLRSAF